MPLTFDPEIAGYRRSYRPRGRLRPRSGLISRFTSSVSPALCRPGSRAGAAACRGRASRPAPGRRGPHPMWGARARESFDLRELGAEFGLDLWRGQRRHGRGARGRALRRGARSRAPRSSTHRGVGLARGEHEQCQPRRARQRPWRHRRAGGELCGSGELAGGAGEPGQVVAFERERPGGEDACAFAGGVRDRGRIAAGGGGAAGGRARAPSCCGAASARCSSSAWRSAGEKRHSRYLRMPGGRSRFWRSAGPGSGSGAGRGFEPARASAFPSAPTTWKARCAVCLRGGDG